MKDLKASVNGVANRPVSEVYAFLADIDGYPGWYPAGVKEATMTSDTQCHTILSLDQGPIQKDFELDMTVTKTPETEIALKRVPKRPGDKQNLEVTWLLAPDVGDAGTALTVKFAATLDIPSFLPLGGVEKAIPQGFLDAALKHLNG